MLTYFLYLVIYFVYFVLFGKLLFSLPLGIKSDDLLAISLFLSFIFALLTALVIGNWAKISNALRITKVRKK